MLERNQPTPLHSVTNVPYNIYFLDAQLALFPDILTINEANEVLYIPSPLLDYLMQTHSKEKVTDTAWTIYLHRYAPNEMLEELEYKDIVSHIDMLTEILEFIIKHYDREDMQPLRYFPRLDYIKGIASLMRTRLDIQFIRIQRLYDRINWQQTKNQALRDINKAIIETYKSIGSTNKTFESLLEKYETAIGDEIDDEFKFNYYQTNLEALLFKATTNPNWKQAELKALGTTVYMGKLESLLGNLDGFDYHLHFFLYQSRVAALIDHDTARAKERAEFAKQQLIDYTKRGEKPLIDHDKHHNHISLTNFNMHISALRGKSKTEKRTMIPTLIEDLLLAKNSIKHASESNKKDFTKAVEIVLKDSLILIRNEMMFMTLENIDDWIYFIEQLKTLIPLFAEVTLDADLGVTAALSTLYESATTENINTLRQLKGELQTELEKNTKELDALNKLNEAYLNNFESIVSELYKELNLKTDENIKTRKIAKHSKPTPPSQATSVMQVSTPLMVGKNTEGDALAAIEEKLKIIHQPDEAEKMLYEGDKHLRQGRIGEALLAYEEALNQTHLQTSPNKGVIKAIKLQLWHTNNTLQIHTQRIEAEKKKLDEKREHFIIKLGMQALKREKVPAKDINLRNQACWDNIYERGLTIFIAIGKNKAKKDLPKSELSLKRNRIEAELKALHGWFDTTARLIHAIEKETNAVNFPALASNPASLFKPESEPKKATKKPAAPKPQRKGKKRK